MVISRAIAPEFSTPALVWGALSLLALAANVYLALLLSLGLVVALWFNREPHRKVPADPLAVLSPIDGSIVRYTKASDPIRNQGMLRITFKKNLLNVFSLRSPTEGKVQEIRLISKGEHSIRSNLVRYAIWIQTDEGDDVIIVAEAARFMRRPRLYINTGERVGQGQRFAYAPFGKRFDVYVPEHSRVSAEKDQGVTSGTSIVAKFLHKKE